MENIDRENMTTQLTGALIGLARATEGNANKPTITTHKAMLSGMGMVFPHMEISRQQIDEVIITLHQEKERLVPRCSECKNPCGRNNDYYIYEINELEPDLSALKYALLSGILSLEPLLQRFPENELFEQAMDFIYRGFFHVGYDCKIEAVSTLLYELEEMRQKLIDAFLKEAATDKNGNALIELKSNNDLIRYFVNLIEAKDLYTQGHSHHVNAIVNAIFNCLPVAYQNKIDNEYVPFLSEIKQVIKHTDIEYTFRMAYDGPVTPGQFFEVSIPKFGEAPISVSGIADGLIDLTIRRVGKVTGEIFERYEGSKLFLRGPYGNGFNLDDYRGKELVVIAGGTGVSPVRGVVDYFANHPGDASGMTLIAGFKTPKDILFRDDFERWKKTIDVILTVDNSEGDVNYQVGLVTEYIPKLKIKDISKATAIAVGPPAMMRFATKGLLDVGFQEGNIWISHERKMCCGIGKCGHCKIGDVYVCLDGPVFNYVKGKTLID